METKLKDQVLLLQLALERVHLVQKKKEKSKNKFNHSIYNPHLFS